MVTCSLPPKNAAGTVVSASGDCTSPRVPWEVPSLLHTRLVTGKFRSDPRVSAVASGASHPNGL